MQRHYNCGIPIKNVQRLTSDPLADSSGPHTHPRREGGRTAINPDC